MCFSLLNTDSERIEDLSLYPSLAKNGLVQRHEDVKVLIIEFELAIPFSRR